MKVPIIGRVWPYISAFAKTLLAAADAAAARTLLGVTPATLGGTGVANNVASTLTISGSFGTTITVTGATTVTLPTTGTLLSSTTKVITTLTTEQQRLAYDGSNYATTTVSSNGRVIVAEEGSSPYGYRIQLGGSGGGDSFIDFTGDAANTGILVVGRGTNSNIGVSTSGARLASTARFCMTGDGNGANPTGIGDGGLDNTITLKAGTGGDVLTCDPSNLTIKSAVALKLGNAATTGLTAGVLAALTNATIVIKDSSGQAYRIPCII